MSKNKDSVHQALKITKTIYVKLPVPAQQVTCNGCRFRMADAILLAEVKTEEERIKVLQDHGVVLQEKLCPHCNNSCRMYVGNHSWRCNRTSVINKKRKKCDFEQTIFKNTWLSKVKLPIGQVLHFMALWCCEAYSVKLALVETRMSHKSVSDWNGFCLEAVEVYMNESLEKLGGSGKVVEIAEARFGKAVSSKAEDMNGVWVLGGIERGSKKVFMVPLENRHPKKLARIIENWVLPGTTVMSDQGKDLGSLEDYGYNHIRVRQSTYDLTPSTVEHTQNIRRKWRDVRDSLPKYGNRYSISSYISKFLFFQKYDDPLYRLHHLLTIIGNVYSPNAFEDN
ncbi:uncharacterized protein LOC143030411 [Oratosquilla oratoria]|uniref:uncharacterized protein LOC143030411 n=1 Tax=Oratosquilla oratoria TaxID=337810 RepID=UPI003F76CE4E